jgi:hypothetical protein
MSTTLSVLLYKKLNLSPQSMEVPPKLPIRLPSAKGIQCGGILTGASQVVTFSLRTKSKFGKE